MGKCIKCGRQGDFRLFCSECYLKDHPILKGTKSAELQVCHLCGKFSHKNKWKPAKNLKAAIEESILDKLELNKEYQIKDIRIVSEIENAEPKPGKNIEAELTIRIKAHSEENRLDVEDDYIVPFTIHFVSCAKCGLSGTKYFQGILQLRNVKPEQALQIEEFARRDSEAGSFINDIEEVRGGIDYYMTSNHHLRRLGIDLQRKFGGILEENPKLQTRDNLASKDLFRVSVLLRLSDVKPGDLAEHNGRVIRIKKTGSLIIGRDIIDNTNVKIDPARSSPQPLEVHKSVITKVKPQIEAMNPVNYQSTRLENPRRQKLGQKIQVVAVGEKLFIVN